jgi:hypothetical protein
MDLALPEVLLSEDLKKGMRLINRYSETVNLSRKVTSGLDDIMKRNLRVSGRRVDFDTLAERVLYDISSGKLQFVARNRWGNFLLEAKD